MKRFSTLCKMFLNLKTIKEDIVGVQATAYNERFGAMAGVVIIHAVVFRTTVSDSRNRVQLSRHFAKPRGVMCKRRTAQWDTETEKK